MFVQVWLKISFLYIYIGFRYHCISAVCVLLTDLSASRMSDTTTIYICKSLPTVS